MQITSLISLAGGAALVAGADLAGFQIAMDPALLVVYGATPATTGAVVDKNATAQAPLLAVPSAVTASSMAIMMVDLDIPSSTQPTTFLHWLQTNLTSSAAGETIMTSQGNLKGFAINIPQTTAAIVAYTQPNPPAQNPLSHRYTQILLNTSSMTPAGLTALQTAAQNRVNFNINTTLAQAGLSQSVVAWNFFNVTNPGPIAAAANVATGAAGSTTKTSASKNNATASTGTGQKAGKAEKSKKEKASASVASGNSTSTDGEKGEKGGKKSKGGVNVASNSTTTAGGGGKKGGKKGKGSANAAGNSTITATGGGDDENEGKKGKGAKNGNSTTSDTGKKGGKNGNSTTSDTGKKGGKGKGGKGNNSTAGGTGTQVSSGAVTTNTSTPGTVTTSASPDRWALHSVVLSLCLVGTAILAL